VLLVGLMVWVGHLLLRWEPRYLPINVVSIEGAVRRLPRERLQETVIRHLEGGILTQDLVALKRAVEELAWIHTASLRRVWPDRLVLSVREHEPLARWDDDGLVTAAGIVFRPGAGELPGGLPGLSGRDGQSVDVVRHYLDWRPRLEAVGLEIVSLALDARGAWGLWTDAGFRLALGKHRVEARMERFLRVYPSIAAAGRPATVDMRYTNGLAVSWRGSEPTGGSVGGTRAEAPGSGGGRVGAVFRAESGVASGLDRELRSGPPGAGAVILPPAVSDARCLVRVRPPARPVPPDPPLYRS
jgi:cell division protein FtsQ